MFQKLDDVITPDITEIAIAGHIRPDGDAIGSSLAVWQYFRKRYPHIHSVVYLEHVPEKFHFLKGFGQIREATEEETYDLFVALDCSTLDRLGKAARYFTTARHTLCVDHHVGNGTFAEENYIIPDASSTCELVYDLMDEDAVDKPIAECLYMGIVHDTGMFQYSCTTSKTMNIAGRLMDKGIDFTGIIDATFQSRTYGQNRILGHALDKAALLADGRIIASWITLEEMTQYGVESADLDMIVSQLRLTRDTQAAIFLYETSPGEYKVSLRSNGTLDVARIAMQYGGGGHKKAAGCNMGRNPREAIQMLSDDIIRALLQDTPVE